MMNTRNHNLRMSGLTRDDIKRLWSKVYDILVTKYDVVNSLGMSSSDLKNDVNSALDKIISHYQSMSMSKSSNRSSRSSSKSSITSTSSTSSQQGGKTNKNRISRKGRRTIKNRKH